MSITWEKVEQDQAGYLYRTKVPGGWLVKDVQDVLTTDEQAGLRMHQDYEWRSSLCFVPDPNHSWEIQSTTCKHGTPKGETCQSCEE